MRNYPILALVRDLFVIAACVAVLVTFYQLQQIRNALSHFGDTSIEQPGGYDDGNGNWCYDPGGGVVCAPQD